MTTAAVFMSGNSQAVRLPTGGLDGTMTKLLFAMFFIATYAGAESAGGIKHAD